MPTLAELVARCLERLEAEGPAALDAVCAEQPSQAEALRARIAELHSLGLLRDTEEAGSIPERLGEFRLLRRLGGGGMGVVYEAEQESLGRRVALKLVRPEHLYFPGARERFRREVEAVARLAHPGIVPVLTHGEERGLPWYAMDLVAGASLDDVLAALQGVDPARLTGADLRRVVEERAGRTAAGEAADRLFGGHWVAACLRVARQVAEALAHAHERGVLHRDVKPSNVMLTPDGRALLLDFGLASAAGSEKLTTTGSHLGSLAYMSPEQLHGDHAGLDARTDVYSLGVTLYELLTLRAAHAAPSAEATSLHVLAGSVSSPRELNATVSHDAETVVLMALDRERERRYASARALAEDLGAVLELRPVAGRRPGAWVRARRWTQRRPGLAVGLVASALVLVGGPLVYAWQQREANVRVQVQRDRAVANLGRARAAVDTMLTEVADQDLLSIPEMEPVRARLLEQALAFYSSFLEENRDDPELRSATARAAWSVSYIHGLLGRYEEALQHNARGLELARQAAAEAPQDEAAQKLVADALAGQANILHRLGRSAEALPHADEALALHRALAALHPDDVQRLEDVDESLGVRAMILQQLGQEEAALTAFREHVDFDESFLAAARGTDLADHALADLVVALNNLGSALSKAGRADEARVPLEHAADIARELDLTTGFDPTRILSVASVNMSLGRVLLATGDAVGGEAQYRLGIATLESAHEHSPAVAEITLFLTATWSNLGVLLAQQEGREAEASSSHARAEELSRELVAATPQVAAHRVALVKTVVNHASLRRDMGQQAESLALFEEALTLLATELPDDPEVHAARHSALWFASLARRDAGELEGAVNAAEELAEAFPDQPNTLRIAAGLVATCAARTGDEAQAAELRQRAMALLRLAVDAGLEGAEFVRTASGMDVLGSEPGFEELMEAVAERD